MWEKRLSTPRDGTLTIRLTTPSRVSVNVELLAVNRRTVLATGHSTGGRTKLKTQICGDRAVIAQVRARNSRGRRFYLQVTSP